MTWPAIRKLRVEAIGSTLIFAGLALATEPDYSNLSLEQLSSIKITSVAKKQQRLSRAAAAVYVITSEDIHRSGLTSVAEILRLAPGLSVARIDASKWAVSSRGFNGRAANKLMVLIDGRSVYSPFFSGVYWDMAMPLPDDIERIEVIRGAGSTMWGANAMNGVVNIITRSAKETRDKELVAGTGTTERADGELRGGGSVGNVAGRGYLSSQDTHQLSTATGQGAQDGWTSEQAGFRTDTVRGADSWTVEGSFFRNDRSENGVTPSLITPPVTIFYTQDAGISGNVSGEWRRQIREGSEFRLNAYYDDTNRPESSLPVVHTRTTDVEAQYRFDAGAGNDVLVGAGERVSAMSVVGDEAYSLSQSSFLYNTASVFAQDEIHLLGDRLLLTAGLKMENATPSGWQTEPNARLLWAPSSKQSVWASVARAVRTPDPYELYSTVSLAFVPPTPETEGLPALLVFNGSEGFRPETLEDFEIGYRVQPSPRFALDWSAFYNDYGQLRSSDPASPTLVSSPTPYLDLPFVFGNFDRADGVGSELAATWNPATRWKVSGSYSWLDLHQGVTQEAPPGSYPGNIQGSPVHQWKVQSYFNVSKTVQTDVFAYYSSSTQPGSLEDLYAVVAPYLRLDVRVGWRVKPGWELSLAGQNLLSPRHLEFLPEGLSSPSYVSRGLYLRSTWRF